MVVGLGLGAMLICFRLAAQQLNCLRAEIRLRWRVDWRAGTVTQGLPLRPRLVVTRVGA
jgi:hypothetical protein